MAPDGLTSLFTHHHADLLSCLQHHAVSQSGADEFISHMARLCSKMAT